MYSSVGVFTSTKQTFENLKPMSNIHKSIELAIIATFLLIIVGCASTSPEGPEAKKDYPKPPDHAKTAVVHYPVATAHKSAENSLAVSGFTKIGKNYDVFLEAERPRHMGLFIGSGGEIFRIGLNPTKNDETEIKVDSIKTFAGMVGQKEWDSTVLAEILRDLNK